MLCSAHGTRCSASVTGTAFPLHPGGSGQLGKNAVNSVPVRGGGSANSDRHTSPCCLPNVRLQGSAGEPVELSVQISGGHGPETQEWFALPGVHVCGARGVVVWRGVKRRALLGWHGVQQGYWRIGGEGGTAGGSYLLDLHKHGFSCVDGEQWTAVLAIRTSCTGHFTQHRTAHLACTAVLEAGSGRCTDARVESGRAVPVHEAVGVAGMRHPKPVGDGLAVLCDAGCLLAICRNFTLH